MCGYSGRHFGAHYEDATCIDGFLWDLDSDDGEGLTSGGDLPCPLCNTSSYLDGAKEDAETTSWGQVMMSVYSGAMIIEGALRLAESVNAKEAAIWKKQNPVIDTFDWPNRNEILAGRANITEPIEIKLAL